TLEDTTTPANRVAFDRRSGAFRRSKDCTLGLRRGGDLTPNPLTGTLAATIHNCSCTLRYAGDGGVKARRGVVNGKHTMAYVVVLDSINRVPGTACSCDEAVTDVICPCGYGATACGGSLQCHSIFFMCSIAPEVCQG